MLLLGIVLAGCGPKTDPRLCDLFCKELHKLEVENSIETVVRRRDLETGRDDYILGRITADTIGGREEKPLHFDCPECDKAYVRILQVRQTK